MLHKRLLNLVLLSTFTGMASAQIDPDSTIESEILNTSVNVQINAGDSIQSATIIEPGSLGGDVDILVTAISRDVDPLFDPDLEVRTLSGTFLGANDDWEEPEGSQNGFIHDVIRCYVQQGIINPGPRDSVVLLSVTTASTNGDTRVVADVRDVDGLQGRTVVSILRVDGSLFNRHTCQDI